MHRLPLFATAIALAGFAIITQPAAVSSFPDVLLWAWESKQDLRFIAPHTAGIAFLERTVWLYPQRVIARPRSQPLLYTPGTPLIAVVRIERPSGVGRELPLAHDAAAAAAEAAKHPGLSAVQIDFDAQLSERSWYASFVRELRQAVPRSMPITMTALESWCEERSKWLDRLPVAEATPMLFRMGPNQNRSPLGFSTAACNSSAGVATDEMPERIPGGPRRIYIFHPGPWNEADYQTAMDRVSAWRARQ